MTVQIASIQNAQDLAGFQDALVQVYRETFALPPYCENEEDVQGFAQRLPHHAQQEGFRCCVAQKDGEILGFAYGATNRPGQWWWERVALAMSQAQVEHWLSNSFGFAELAVKPNAQRRGIGGQLHDALLMGLPHRTAMLSTQHDAVAAMELYRKRGWVVLLDEFFFPGGTTPRVIMGLSLHEV